ncbi:MAG: hypothetical protein OXD30_13635, partial [Bryobacterales bacterium]|nr:hypothetical protein [Bryobacterales bacterium]
YYEFQAIDRPLDESDKEALRSISSRAEITATRFTNVYHYGDFHGDSRKLMERWFDLHLYLANWGTRQLMLRLPKRLVDRAALDPFVSAVEEVELLEAGENLIIDACFYGEDGESYYAIDGEGEGCLDSIAPLRDSALSGDLRLFYVLWLVAVEKGVVPAGAEEPLPGIGPLTSPLASLAEFFRIDQDLLSAAAEMPSDADGGCSFADVSRATLQAVPDSEKTALLLRLVDGDPHVAAEVRGKVRTAWAVAQGQSNCRRRTVAELQGRSRIVRDRRMAEEARRREEERLRKEREAERARRKRLDATKARGARVWDEVEVQVQYVNAPGYNRATELLVDLRTLAQEAGEMHEFARHIESIRRRHARKPAFIKRLDRNRLGLG